MISQGFAKLGSNFIPIMPVPKGNGDGSVWDGVIMIAAGWSLMLALLLFFRWWSE